MSRLPRLASASLLLAGCSGAIYSEFDFRTGQPPRAGSPGATWASRAAAAGMSTTAMPVMDVPAPGAAPGAAPAGTAAAPATGRGGKAEVLAALGPPGEVLALASGDVFVYRLRLTDVDVLNLNTSIFTGIILPIFARVEGKQRDDVLLVQFDASGRVTAVSAAGR